MISIVLMLVLNGQSLALHEGGDMELVAPDIQTAAVSIGQSDQDDDTDRVAQDVQNATVNVGQSLTVPQEGDDVDLVTPVNQTATVSVDRSDHDQDNDGMELGAQDAQTTTSVGVGQSHTLSHGDDDVVGHIQAAGKKPPWILTYPNYFVSLEASYMWCIAMYVCMYVCGGVF